MIDELQVIIDTPTKKMLDNVSLAIEEMIERKLDISSIGELLQESVNGALEKKIRAIQSEISDVRQDIGNLQKNEPMRALINALNKTSKQW